MQIILNLQHFVAVKREKSTHSLVSHSVAEDGVMRLILWCELPLKMRLVSPQKGEERQEEEGVQLCAVALPAKSAIKLPAKAMWPAS